MKPATILRELRRALDALHVAANNAALDHATHPHKDTPATWVNALRFVDAANYACDLLDEARQAVQAQPTPDDARALRHAEHRMREIALTYMPEYQNDLGENDAHRTYH